jgi:hypothetical protein
MTSLIPQIRHSQNVSRAMWDSYCVEQIVSVSVIAVAVLITLLLTCFERIQRQLRLDRQSLTMLRLFSLFEMLLLLLVATSPMPFNVFIVLHQLLLAYPGNKLFKIVAAIMCLRQEGREEGDT